jgi:hypothetical protein
MKSSVPCVFALVAAAVTPAGVALAQTAPADPSSAPTNVSSQSSQGMGQVLAERVTDLPPTLRLRDLDANWRALRITTLAPAKAATENAISQMMQLDALSGSRGSGKSGGDAASALIGMSMLGGLFGGMGPGSDGGGEATTYYTRGQTVTFGGETFLVAYSHQKQPVNLMQMALESEKNGNKEPDFAKLAAANKLTAESPLALSLVNVRAVALLSNVRAFDLNGEIAESAKAGGGLMDLIASEMAKEQAAKPIAGAPKPPRPKTAPAKSKANTRKT